MDHVRRQTPAKKAHVAPGEINSENCRTAPIESSQAGKEVNSVTNIVVEGTRNDSLLQISLDNEVPFLAKLHLHVAPSEEPERHAFIMPNPRPDNEKALQLLLLSLEMLVHTKCLNCRKNMC